MPQKQERQEKGSWCLIAVAVISMILFLGLIVFYFAIWRVPDNSAEASKIRENLKVKLKKANAIAKDENAWLDYLKANESYNDIVEGHSSDVVFKENPKDEDYDIISKFIDKNEKTLYLTEKALHKEYFQIPRKYKDGRSEKIPNFLKLRQLAFFLTLAADKYVKDGDNMKAAQLYMQCLYLGEGIRRNTTMLYELVGIAVNQAVLKHLRVFLTESEAAPEVYEFIIKQMERFDAKHQNFQETIKNEMLSNYYDFQNIRSGSGSLGGIPRGTISKIGFFLDREERITENLYLEALKIKVAPGNYKKSCKKLKNLKDNIPLLTIFPRIMMVDYKTFQHYVKDRVLYKGTLLLAALKLYKSRQGSYPDKLSELVPKYLSKLPVDYFSPNGKFVYQKKGDDFVLYSIGDDLKDDRGKFESDDKEVGGPGDIIFKGAS